MILLDEAISGEIINNNAEREERMLSQYACRSSQAIRRFPEELEDRSNIRPAFFHDGDRIMHSHAYARYIDKTQVFSLFENDHITHRVLHVQFVSKIARTIGRFLRLNEDLIEAISLGHDLGHVPYGHDGESFLNGISEASGQGYFTHNAQSARCMMELEQQGGGLNLTVQVLDGILCHNGEALADVYRPDYHKSCVQLLDEYARCWSVRDFSRRLAPMTLEGCVVRISDIVAYIGRDIEDAITVKLMAREQLPAAITDVLGNTNRDIINNLILDLTNHSYGKEYLHFSGPVRDALAKLRAFNYEYIYHNPRKLTQNAKIANMFRQLFDRYLQDLQSGSRDSSIYRWLIGSMGAEYLRRNTPERIVLDYIAGMTDDFFNNEFKDMFLPKSFGMSIED